MSSASDDDGSEDVKRASPESRNSRSPPTSPNSPKSRKKEESVAQRITDLSDDSSDDGRMPDRVEPKYEKKRSREDDDDSEDSSDEERPRKRTVIDAHERTVVRRELSDKKVEILHFPPTLPVASKVSGVGKPPPSGIVPISYRPLKKFRGNCTKPLLHALNKGVHTLTDVLETNTYLVTWPDGTRTLAVGDKQYTIVNDKLASDFYIMRKGEDVQTFESHVKSVGRVQPSTLSMGMQSSLLSASNSLRKPQRKMMRTLDQSGEHEEKIARDANARKERERVRADAKRRSTIERHNPRTPRQSQQHVYDSEPEMSDGEADRLADRQRRHGYDEPSLKRRKAGRRKILGSDDESSDEE